MSVSFQNVHHTMLWIFTEFFFILEFTNFFMIINKKFVKAQKITSIKKKNQISLNYILSILVGTLNRKSISHTEAP